METDVKKRWFVYMVQCRGGAFYTGYSCDVEKRVEKHNSGKGAKYTRSRRPVILAYVQEYPDRSLAMKAEYALKHMPRKHKILLSLVYKHREAISQLQ